MCISNYNNFKHELIYDFLEHITEKFLENLSEEKLDQALAYSFKDFVDILRYEVKSFHADHPIKKKKSCSSFGSGFTYYSGNKFLILLNREFTR